MPGFIECRDRIVPGLSRRDLLRIIDLLDEAGSRSEGEARKTLAKGRMAAIHLEGLFDVDRHAASVSDLVANDDQRDAQLRVRKSVGILAIAATLVDLRPGETA